MFCETPVTYRDFTKSSVRPQYPTEISQTVLYHASTLQIFHRQFCVTPIPYRDFTKSSVTLPVPYRSTSTLQNLPLHYFLALAFPFYAFCYFCLVPAKLLYGQYLFLVSLILPYFLDHVIPSYSSSPFSYFLPYSPNSSGRQPFSWHTPSVILPFQLYHVSCFKWVYS